jgi:hypothetical protein
VGDGVAVGGREEEEEGLGEPEHGKGVVQDDSAGRLMVGRPSLAADATAQPHTEEEGSSAVPWTWGAMPLLPPSCLCPAYPDTKRSLALAHCTLPAARP